MENEEWPMHMRWAVYIGSLSRAAFMNTADAARFIHSHRSDRAKLSVKQLITNELFAPPRAGPNDLETIMALLTAKDKRPVVEDL